MKEEIIEVTRDKRLIIRLYEESGLIDLIIMKAPFVGQESWLTKEHIVLKLEKTSGLEMLWVAPQSLKQVYKGRGRP